MDGHYANNNWRFAILVDSGCDVPEEYLSNYPIYVIPLKINYKDKTYRDRIDITPEEIYQYLDTEIPTTSLPTFEDAKEIFDRIAADGFSKLIAINISSNLSGTYNLIRLVIEEYSKKGMEVYHLDTKNIAIASGMYAMIAARHLKEGLDFADAVQQLKQEYGNAKVFFYVETLEYLRKGGRIGRVASTISSVLDIKPVITCDEDGVYCVAAKDRGRNRCINKAIALIADFIGEHKNAEIALMYSGIVQGIDEIREKIEKRFPDFSVKIRGQISPALGIHVGPGLIGIAVCRYHDIK